MVVLVYVTSWSGPLSAQGSDRIYKSLPDPVRVIDLDEEEIYRPGALAMHQDGSIALYAYDRYKLILIPPNGDIVTIGDGQGRGPREFLNIIDLSFGKDGNLWAIDSNQARVTVWSRQNELLRTETLEGLNPYRIVVGEDRILISSPGFTGHGGFHLFSKESFHRIPSSELFLNKERGEDPVALDGQLVAVSGAIFFAPLYFGTLSRFDWSGRLLWEQQAIEEVVYPNVPGSQPMWSVSMDASIATLQPAYDGQHLYLLFGGEGHRIGTVIDVYDPVTGDYLHSYDVTKRANGLAAANGKLALKQHEEGIFEIVVYDMQ